MRIRELLIATAGIGFLLGGAGVASAGPFGLQPIAPPTAQLPQACVDAGATTAAECTALLRKAKEPETPPAAVQPAEPAEAASPKKPPVEPAVIPAEQNADGVPGKKPAPHRAPEPPAAAQPAEPVEPVSPKKPPAEPAVIPADQNADGVPGKKPAPHRAPEPPASVAAPPASVATPTVVAPPAGPPAGSTDRHPHRPLPPAGEAVAPPAVAPAPVTPAATNGTTAPGSEPRVRGPRLSKDCVAAGIQTKAECDALHANGPDAGAVAPAPVSVTPPPAVAPVVTGPRPAHKPPAGTAPAALPTAATPQPPAPPAPAVTTPRPAGPFGLAPKGVPPELVAPLFDSAKDAETNDGKTIGGPAGPGPASPGPAHHRPPAPQGGPPPASDEAAQTAIQPGTIPPIDKAQGQQFTPDASQGIGMQLPSGARIVQPGTADRFVPGGPGGDRRGHRPGGPGGPDFSGGPPPGPDPLGLALGTIVQLGNQLIINSPGQDQRRIAGGEGDRSDYERLPGNRYRETVTRPNGIRIVTIYSQNGDVLRRSRFDQDGRETVLAYFDARHDGDLSDWRDPGDDLPPLQPDIAPQDYVLDADQASESQVQRFFAQPPVEAVQRLYSIDEVKRSARIRDMVRRLELGDLTFDTGAATIAEDQVQNLDNVAQAMLGLLQRNPAETFLIEGHTDAVGSDISNLQLSDARAATVAEILTDFYHVPPENLATQGYGERFLIVQTDGPERLNRRVTIRRITPLITVANQPY